MADESTYLIQLAAWLGQAIGDTAPLFADFSTDTLGLSLPGTVVQASAVTNALNQAATTAKQVGDAATALDTAAATQDEVKILEGFVQLGLALGQFYGAIKALETGVSANITAGTIPDAQARTAAQ